MKRIYSSNENYPNMKIKIFLISFLTLVLLYIPSGFAQNKADFDLGKGLNFSLNDGDYQFRIGGMIQPSVSFVNVDKQTDYYFFAKHTFFNLSGEFLKQHLSFFIQTDFSLGTPLLDAWIAYKPFEDFTITFGQKQNISNNREMLLMEDKLQFSDRSLLSTEFSSTGREFGIFIDKKIKLNNLGIEPQIAVTSGDGRNSFGADSRDVDLGGLKYGARLDIYPLGYFSENNGDFIADLEHETSPKICIGGAASYNVGVSNEVGEGHGDFNLYDKEGNLKLPDYRKLYTEILVKYSGFSLLGEYGIATATSLDDIYTTPSVSTPLIPTQISEYLSLGSGYNVQLGYVTKSGYALDVRYDNITPEFQSNPNSIISKTTGWTFGFSKYFKKNDLKLQSSFSSINSEKNGKELSGSITLQVVL